MSDGLLLIGGGGHCRSILDSLFRLKAYERLGIIDTIEGPVMGVDVLGDESILPSLLSAGFEHAFVAVGSVGNPSIREMLFERVLSLGFAVPNIIDPSAIVSDDSSFGRGVFVGKGSIVGPCCKIGDNAILNSGCIVEHDCEIGRHVHIAPGATLCGGVCVGDECHIGANATVIQECKIGARSIIGMGSVVLRAIPDASVAYGSPARIRNNA